jgi:hypothetical protein
MRYETKRLRVYQDDCLCDALQWARELFENFNEFPAGSRQTIAAFVGLPEAELELVKIVVPEPEPEQKTAEAVPEETPVADSGKSKGAGVFGGIMAAVKFGKATSKDEEAAGSNKPGMLTKALSTLSGKEEAAAPPPPPVEIPKITVYVSRGSGLSGHPTYEV